MAFDEKWESLYDALWPAARARVEAKIDAWVAQYEYDQQDPSRIHDDPWSW